MTMTKRTQGRPPRNSGINGRDKLIEATRSYLQTNRKMSLTRTEIAQECGVTPALISYYFKDKRSLLDAVTKPLIRTYLEKLESILETDAPVDSRMQDTVRLMLEMNAENAFLVDYMLGLYHSNKLDEEDRRAFTTIHRGVASLVAELVAAQVWRVSDPLLTEVALWGMCRAFGEAIRARRADPLTADSHGDLLHRKVDYVCRAFGHPVTAVPEPALMVAV